MQIRHTRTHTHSYIHLECRTATVSYFFFIIPLGLMRSWVYFYVFTVYFLAFWKNRCYNHECVFIVKSETHTLVSVFKLDNGKKLQENIICTKT